MELLSQQPRQEELYILEELVRVTSIFQTFISMVSGDHISFSTSLLLFLALVFCSSIQQERDPYEIHGRCEGEDLYRQSTKRGQYERLPSITENEPIYRNVDHIARQGS